MAMMSEARQSGGGFGWGDVEQLAAERPVRRSRREGLAPAFRLPSLQE
jgi:hypothetical protein